MKTYGVHILIVALIFIFAVSATESINAQDETIESVSKEIEEIRREKLRVLKEIRDAERQELEVLKGTQNNESNPVDNKIKSEDDNSDSAISDKEDNKPENISISADPPKPVILNAMPVFRADGQATVTIPSMQAGAANTVVTAPVQTNDTKKESGIFETGATEDRKCSQISPSELVNESNFKRALCGVINKIVIGRTGRKDLPKLELSDSEDPLIRIVVATIAKGEGNRERAKIRNFLLKSEKLRTDKQIGSDAKSNGTTSIVSKGGIPMFLSYAVENGAAVSSTTGNTMTFRVNPAGLFQTITGAGFVDLLRERRENPPLKFLGKTSLGFSFDTSRGADTPTLTGNANQLSAVSLRYEHINDRNPTSEKYQNIWNNFVNDDAERLFQAKNELFKRIYKIKPIGEPKEFRILQLTEWLTEINSQLQIDATTINALSLIDAKDKIENLLQTTLENLPVALIKANPAISDLFASVELDSEYVAARQVALDKISKGRVLTFEYTNLREPVKPDTHSMRFIWEKGFYKNLDFTVNAALTLYNKKPANAGVKGLRDFDISGQFDIPVRGLELGIIKDSVLSFAGRYQRLNSDIVDERGFVLPGTKGDIAVGQLKFTIPIGDTGIKLPFSFTLANRSELVKETEMRGNFGFTLDVDSILTRLKAFKLPIQ